MTESQDEKLATADEAFEKWFEDRFGFKPRQENGFGDHSTARKAWDARQAEIDRLAAEYAELRATLVAICKVGGRAELIKERDQLRELAGELAFDPVLDADMLNRIKDLLGIIPKALGIGGEG